VTAIQDANKVLVNPIPLNSVTASVIASIIEAKHLTLAQITEVLTVIQAAGIPINEQNLPTINAIADAVTVYQLTNAQITSAITQIRNIPTLSITAANIAAVTAIQDANKVLVNPIPLNSVTASVIASIIEAKHLTLAQITQVLSIIQTAQIPINQQNIGTINAISDAVTVYQLTETQVIDTIQAINIWNNQAATAANRIDVTVENIAVVKVLILAGISVTKDTVTQWSNILDQAMAIASVSNVSPSFILSALQAVMRTGTTVSSAQIVVQTARAIQTGSLSLEEAVVALNIIAAVNTGLPEPVVVTSEILSEIARALSVNGLPFDKVVNAVRALEISGLPITAANIAVVAALEESGVVGNLAVPLYVRIDGSMLAFGTAEIAAGTSVQVIQPVGSDTRWRVKIAFSNTVISYDPNTGKTYVILGNLSEMEVVPGMRINSLGEIEIRRIVGEGDTAFVVTAVLHHDGALSFQKGSNMYGNVRINFVGVTDLLNARVFGLNANGDIVVTFADGRVLAITVEGKITLNGVELDATGIHLPVQLEINKADGTVTLTPLINGQLSSNKIIVRSDGSISSNRTSVIQIVKNPGDGTFSVLSGGRDLFTADRVVIHLDGSIVLTKNNGLGSAEIDVNGVARITIASDVKHIPNSSGGATEVILGVRKITIHPSGQTTDELADTNIIRNPDGSYTAVAKNAQGQVIGVTGYVDAQGNIYAGFAQTAEALKQNPEFKFVNDGVGIRRVHREGTIELLNRAEDGQSILTYQAPIEIGKQGVLSIHGVSVNVSRQPGEPVEIRLASATRVQMVRRVDGAVIDQMFVDHVENGIRIGGIFFQSGSHITLDLLKHRIIVTNTTASKTVRTEVSLTTGVIQITTFDADENEIDVAVQISDFRLFGTDAVQFRSDGTIVIQRGGRVLTVRTEILPNSFVRTVYKAGATEVTLPDGQQLRISPVDAQIQLKRADGTVIDTMIIQDSGEIKFQGLKIFEIEAGSKVEIDHDNMIIVTGILGAKTKFSLDSSAANNTRVSINNTVMNLAHEDGHNIVGVVIEKTGIIKVTYENGEVIRRSIFTSEQIVTAYLDLIQETQTAQDANAELRRLFDYLEDLKSKNVPEFNQIVNDSQHPISEMIRTLIAEKFQLVGETTTQETIRNSYLELKDLIPAFQVLGVLDEVTVSTRLSELERAFSLAILTITSGLPSANNIQGLITTGIAGPKLKRDSAGALLQQAWLLNSAPTKSELEILTRNGEAEFIIFYNMELGKYVLYTSGQKESVLGSEGLREYFRNPNIQVFFHSQPTSKLPSSKLPSEIDFIEFLESSGRENGRQMEFIGVMNGNEFQLLVLRRDADGLLAGERSVTYDGTTYHYDVLSAEMVPDLLFALLAEAIGSQPVMRAFQELLAILIDLSNQASIREAPGGAVATSQIDLSQVVEHLALFSRYAVEWSREKGYQNLKGLLLFTIGKIRTELEESGLESENKLFAKLYSFEQLFGRISTAPDVKPDAKRDEFQKALVELFIQSLQLYQELVGESVPQVSERGEGGVAIATRPRPPPLKVSERYLQLLAALHLDLAVIADYEHFSQLSSPFAAQVLINFLLGIPTITFEEYEQIKEDKHVRVLAQDGSVSIDVKTGIPQHIDQIVALIEKAAQREIGDSGQKIAAAIPIVFTNHGRKAEFKGNALVIDASELDDSNDSIVLKIKITMAIQAMAKAKQDAKAKQAAKPSRPAAVTRDSAAPSVVPIAPAAPKVEAPISEVPKATESAKPAAPAAPAPVTTVKTYRENLIEALAESGDAEIIPLLETGKLKRDDFWHLFKAMYEKLRHGKYAPASHEDKNIAEKTGKSTETTEVLEVDVNNPWHTRVTKGLKLEEPGDRISLSVFAHPELIEALDEFFAKNGLRGYYKTSVDYESWSRRHDPITIYFYDGLTPEIEAAIVRIASAHIRSSEEGALHGRKIADGIYAQRTPKLAGIEALINEAYGIGGEELKRGVIKYFGYFNYKGKITFHASAGEVVVVEQFLANYDQVLNVKKATDPTAAPVASNAATATALLTQEQDQAQKKAEALSERRAPENLLNLESLAGKVRTHGEMASQISNKATQPQAKPAAPVAQAAPERDVLEREMPWHELVRDAKQRVPEEVNDYWRNNADARKFFRDFLSKMLDGVSKGLTVTFGEFKAMLLEAHRQAAVGADLNTPRPYYQKDGLYVSPGVLREGSGWRNNYRDEARSVAELAHKVNDEYFDYLKNPNGVHVVQLDRVSEEAKPRNLGTMHLYPDAVHVDAYFEAMRQILSEFAEMKKNGASQSELVAKIAEFYQYAANARPFTQINNSLFMNMANAMLREAGLAGITHGILDHAAMRLQPAIFAKLFLEAVKEANPAVSSLSSVEARDKEVGVSVVESMEYVASVLAATGTTDRSTRTVAREAEKVGKSAIQRADSFEKLFVVLEQLGSLVGRNGAVYSATDLKLRIEVVLRGEADITSITSTSGLRNKVEELIKVKAGKSMKPAASAKQIKVKVEGEGLRRAGAMRTLTGGTATFETEAANVGDLLASLPEALRDRVFVFVNGKEVTNDRNLTFQEGDNIQLLNKIEGGKDTPSAATPIAESPALERELEVARLDLERKRSTLEGWIAELHEAESSAAGTASYGDTSGHLVTLSVKDLRQRVQSSLKTYEASLAAYNQLAANKIQALDRRLRLVETALSEHAGQLEPQVRQDLELERDSLIQVKKLLSPPALQKVEEEGQDAVRKTLEDLRSRVKETAASRVAEMIASLKEDYPDAEVTPYENGKIFIVRHMEGTGSKRSEVVRIYDAERSEIALYSGSRDSKNGNLTLSFSRNEALRQQVVFDQNGAILRHSADRANALKPGKDYFFEDGQLVIIQYDEPSGVAYKLKMDPTGKIKEVRPVTPPYSDETRNLEKKIADLFDRSSNPEEWDLAQKNLLDRLQIISKDLHGRLEKNGSALRSQRTNVKLQIEREEITIQYILLQERIAGVQRAATARDVPVLKGRVQQFDGQFKNVEADKEIAIFRTETVEKDARSVSLAYDYFKQLEGATRKRIRNEGAKLKQAVLRSAYEAKVRLLLKALNELELNDEQREAIGKVIRQISDADKSSASLEDKSVRAVRKLVDDAKRVLADDANSVNATPEEIGFETLLKEIDELFDKHKNLQDLLVANLKGLSQFYNDELKKPHFLLVDNLERLGEFYKEELKKPHLKSEILFKFLVALTLSQRHFEGKNKRLTYRGVQLLAGAALAQGKIVGVPTAEGKTVVFAIRNVIKAFSGYTVNHLVTMEEFVQSDLYEDQLPIYASFGITARGIDKKKMDHEAIREAYTKKDGEPLIIYVSVSDLQFIFLDDQRSTSPVLSGKYIFTIDEIDNVMMILMRFITAQAGARLADKHIEMFQGLAHMAQDMIDKNQGQAFERISTRGYSRLWNRSRQLFGGVKPGAYFLMRESYETTEARTSIETTDAFHKIVDHLFEVFMKQFGGDMQGFMEAIGYDESGKLTTKEMAAQSVEPKAMFEHLLYRTLVMLIGRQYDRDFRLVVSKDAQGKEVSEDGRAVHDLFVVGKDGKTTSQRESDFGATILEALYQSFVVSRGGKLNISGDTKISAEVDSLSLYEQKTHAWTEEDGSKFMDLAGSSGTVVAENHSHKKDHAFRNLLVLLKLMGKRENPIAFPTHVERAREVMSGYFKRTSKGTFEDVYTDTRKYQNESYRTIVRHFFKDGAVAKWFYDQYVKKYINEVLNKTQIYLTNNLGMSKKAAAEALNQLKPLLKDLNQNWNNENEKPRAIQAIRDFFKKLRENSFEKIGTTVSALVGLHELEEMAIAAGYIFLLNGSQGDFGLKEARDGGYEKKRDPEGELIEEPRDSGYLRGVVFATNAFGRGIDYAAPNFEKALKRLERLGVSQDQLREFENLRREFMSEALRDLNNPQVREAREVVSQRLRRLMDEVRTEMLANASHPSKYPSNLKLAELEHNLNEAFNHIGVAIDYGEVSYSVGAARDLYDLEQQHSRSGRNQVPAHVREIFIYETDFKPIINLAFNNLPNAKKSSNESTFKDLFKAYESSSGMAQEKIGQQLLNLLDEARMDITDAQVRRIVIEHEAARKEFYQNQERLQHANQIKGPNGDGRAEVHAQLAAEGQEQFEKHDAGKIREPILENSKSVSIRGVSYGVSRDKVTGEVVGLLRGSDEYRFNKVKGYSAKISRTPIKATFEVGSNKYEVEISQDGKEAVVIGAYESKNVDEAIGKTDKTGKAEAKGKFAQFIAWVQSLFLRGVGRGVQGNEAVLRKNLARVFEGLGFHKEAKQIEGFKGSVSELKALFHELLKRVEEQKVTYAQAAANEILDQIFEHYRQLKKHNPVKALRILNHMLEALSWHYVEVTAENVNDVENKLKKVGVRLISPDLLEIALSELNSVKLKEQNEIRSKRNWLGRPLYQEEGVDRNAMRRAAKKAGRLGERLFFEHEKNKGTFMADLARAAVNGTMDQLRKIESDESELRARLERLGLEEVKKPSVKDEGSVKDEVKASYMNTFPSAELDAAGARAQAEIAKETRSLKRFASRIFGWTVGLMIPSALIAGLAGLAWFASVSIPALAVASIVGVVTATIASYYLRQRVTTEQAVENGVRQQSERNENVKISLPKPSQFGVKEVVQYENRGQERRLPRLRPSHVREAVEALEAASRTTPEADAARRTEEAGVESVPDQVSLESRGMNQHVTATTTNASSNAASRAVQNALTASDEFTVDCGEDPSKCQALRTTLIVKQRKRADIVIENLNEEDRKALVQNPEDLLSRIDVRAVGYFTAGGFSFFGAFERTESGQAGGYVIRRVESNYESAVASDLELELLDHGWTRDKINQDHHWPARIIQDRREWEWRATKDGGRARVHRQAIVDPNAILRDGAVVGSHARVEAGAVIGKSTVVGRQAVVRSQSVLGEGAVIGSGVIVDRNVQIGKNVYIKNRETEKRQKDSKWNERRSVILAESIVGEGAQIHGSVIQGKVEAKAYIENSHLSGVEVLENTVVSGINSDMEGIKPILNGSRRMSRGRRIIFQDGTRKVYDVMTQAEYDRLGRSIIPDSIQIPSSTIGRLWLLVRLIARHWFDKIRDYLFVTEWRAWKAQRAIDSKLKEEELFQTNRYFHKGGKVKSEEEIRNDAIDLVRQMRRAEHKAWFWKGAKFGIGISAVIFGLIYALLHVPFVALGATPVVIIAVVAFGSIVKAKLSTYWEKATFFMKWSLSKTSGWFDRVESERFKFSVKWGGLLAIGGVVSFFGMPYLLGGLGVASLVPTTMGVLGTASKYALGLIPLSIMLYHNYEEWKLMKGGKAHVPGPGLWYRLNYWLRFSVSAKARWLRSQMSKLEEDEVTNFWFEKRVELASGSQLDRKKVSKAYQLMKKVRGLARFRKNMRLQKAVQERQKKYLDVISNKYGTTALNLYGQYHHFRKRIDSLQKKLKGQSDPKIERKIVTLQKKFQKWQSEKVPCGQECLGYFEKTYAFEKEVKKLQGEFLEEEKKKNPDIDFEIDLMDLYKSRLASKTGKTADSLGLSKKETAEKLFSMHPISSVLTPKDLLSVLEKHHLSIAQALNMINGDWFGD
ncbi:MAG: hypothetical protein HY584_02975, partial [Candidatus Omnitrophica bacterium]|nr:hypothetical protein [Candidatus Omnitrophota bacterium]